MSTTHRDRAPSGWLRLLRVIGVVFVAYSVVNVAIRLLLDGTIDTVRVVRFGLFLAAGVGMWARRREGIWIGIAALVIYTLPMVRYSMTHVEGVLTLGILARAMLVVVLLHPGARAALRPQPAHEVPPPTVWVVTVAGVCSLFMVAGPIVLLVRVLVG